MAFYYDYYMVDEEEVSITIFDSKREVVHRENIISEWIDTDDVVDTVKAVAEGHGFTPVLSLAAASLGAKGGRMKNETKAKASRENGKKGGRPKGSKKKDGG